MNFSRKRRRFSMEERKQIFHKFGGRCAYCGRLMRYNDMHIDHITPFSRNGEDKVENLFPSCKDCDTVKGSLTPSEFRKKLQNMSYELENQPQFRTALRFGIVKRFPYQRVRFYYETKGVKK